MQNKLCCKNFVVSYHYRFLFPLSRKCDLQARNYPPLRRTLTLFRLNHYLQCQNSALWGCHVTFNIAFYWLVWTCNCMIEPHWWTCIILIQTKHFQLVKRITIIFSDWYCVFYAIEMQTEKHIQLISQFLIFGDMYPFALCLLNWDYI